MYLGSWGTWYLTEEMLAYFAEIKKQNTDAKFLILSPDKVDVDDYDFKKDVITVCAPRHLVPLYISLAKAAVFFIKPSYSKKASSATKLGEILAMNVPVITNKGWGDIESELISKCVFFGINGIRLPKGDSGRDYAGQYLSLQNGIEAYHLVYQSILA